MWLALDWIVLGISQKGGFNLGSYLVLSTSLPMFKAHILRKSEIEQSQDILGPVRIFWQVDNTKKEIGKN